MQSGLTVVVCSYNPEKEIFERVLIALADAARSVDSQNEYLIVDNNSAKPILEEEYVQQFLNKTGNSRVIVERKQGLTSARIRGIREAGREWLLFIDDDNEIESDYLSQSFGLIEKFPFLAAFNAGVIRVQYMGKVDEWFLQNGKSHFQESDIPFTIWGNDYKTFRHWPFGTGMLIMKDVCDSYVRKVNSGAFTLTDRKGSLLTSGGDGQLVSCALELGYGVGRARELKLNHLISSGKATMSYLTKMDYGIYYSNELFLKECFPEELLPITRVKEIKILVNAFFRQAIRAIIRNNYKTFSINLASQMGRLEGNRAAFKKSPSRFLRLVSRRFYKRK